MTLKISLQKSRQIEFIRQNWKFQVKKNYMYNFANWILKIKIPTLNQISSDYQDILVSLVTYILLSIYK